MTDLERQTENNRMMAITELNAIIDYAEVQLRRAKEIPLLNDEEHADWVAGYEERIHDIMLDMSELANFGHIKG